jgi:hypothetical protein
MCFNLLFKRITPLLGYFNVRIVKERTQMI